MTRTRGARAVGLGLALAVVCGLSNVARAQTEVGGRISEDTTWTLAGSPYVVTSDVQVYGDTSPFDSTTPVTLTIEPGVEVRFDSGTELEIAAGPDKGALVAVGTPAQPIRFTGNATFPLDGHWNGIVFDDGTLDATTVLSHVVVEYAGSSSGGSLRLNAAAPSIDNATVGGSLNDCINLETDSHATFQDVVAVDCARFGVRVDDADPTFDQLTVSSVGDSGFRVAGTSSPSLTNATIERGVHFETATGTPVVSNVTIELYSAQPSRLPADLVGTFLSTATLNGTDANSALEVLGEGMDASATWPNLGFPYEVVSGDIDLNGSVGAPAILTLDPGVTIAFDDTSGIFVATGTNESAGLIAAGTALEPILLTSLLATPARGDWEGIDFGAGSDPSSRLEHVTVEYIGRTNSGVEITSSSPTVRDCTIRESSVHGILISGSNASPTIVDNTITGVDDNGIRANNTGAALIDGNVITDTGAYGIRVNETLTPMDHVITDNAVANSIFFDSGAGDATLTGNTFTNYDAFPARLGADDVGEFLNANTNDASAGALLEVLADTIDADATWPNSGLDLVVLGDLFVRGTVDTAATLTLGAGIELRFNTSAGLNVGGATELGALVAVGTAGNPIVFTSSASPAAPGDWDGILFDDSTVDGTSVLDNVVVEFAGNTTRNANVQIDNASPTIANSTLRDSNRYGVYFTGTQESTALISGNAFSGNVDYDLFSSSSTPHAITVDGNTMSNGLRLDTTSSTATVTGNTFENYASGLGVRVDASTLVNMSGNSYTGTLDGSFIEVLGETVRESGTWLDQGLPYRMVNTTDIVILGDTEVATTITIEAGTTFEMNTDGRIQVGDNTSLGALIAVGTAVDPIVFTSSQETPARGDIQGIFIDQQSVDGTTVLDHVTVEFAGAANTDCLIIEDSAPLVQNFTCRESSRNGIRLSGSNGTDPTILNSTIQGVDQDGISVATDPDGVPTFEGNTIDDVGRYGILFDRETQATVRSNVLTNIADYGIFLDGTTGSISPRLIDNSIEHGIYLENNIGGTRRMTGNTFSALAGFNPRIRATDVQQLVNFNTFEGEDADTRIEVYGATIDRPSRWSNVGIPYHVFSGDVTVSGGSDTLPAVMKVEPGVIIEFASTSQLHIDTVLNAVGTEAEPIVFTSDAETPAPGGWEGIYFDDGIRDERCVLDNVIVEYAGRTTTTTNIVVDQSEPTIRNSIIRFSGDDGIRIDVSTSSPNIVDNVFEGNEDYDIYVDDNSNAIITGNSFTNGIFFRVAGGDPTISGNTFDDYVDHFLRVGAADLAEVSGNTFNGASADAVVEVLGERIDTSAQWLNLGFPYAFVSGDVEVYGNSFLPATLTIEPGTRLQFDSVRLRIGTTSANDKAALVANGTAALPIVFTSNEDTPTAGDWRGIYFDRSSDNDLNSLSNCTVEYAGQTYNANVRFDISAATITNCQFNDSSVYGVYSSSNEAGLTLQTNTFANNADYDVFLASGGTTEAVIANNAFTNGLFIDSTAGDSVIQNNTFDDYADHYVRLDASSLDTFVGNVFNGVGADAVIEVRGEVVTEDAQWLNFGFPYDFFSGSVTVRGDTAEAPVTVTIQPGATLQFGSSVGLFISTTSTVQLGTLVADGTPAQPITFTSNRETPAPGDWLGIYFDSGWDNAASLLDNVVVEYGGQSNSANVRLQRSGPTITNSTIRESSVYGVYGASATSSPIIDATSFSANADYDVYIDGTSNALITGNQFATGLYFDDAGGDPVVTGNLFQDYNTDHFLRIGAASIDADFGTNVFQALDATSQIELLGETITVSRTWPNVAMPFHVLGRVDVQSSDSTPILTIDPGTEMLFDAGTGIYVAASSSQNGGLTALGTGVDPIVFTSSAETPTAGDWPGLYFGNGTDDAASILSNAVVEYGGQTNSSNVRIVTAAPSIQSSVIRHSSVYGIYASNSPSDPLIDGNVFTDNADFDLYLEDEVNAQITNNTFNSGVFFETATGDSTLSGNTFNNYNTDRFLRLGLSNLSLAFGSNVFNDTDETSVIEVIGETIDESLTWPAFQFPYRVIASPGADINVGSTTSTPVLTLAAGLTVRFDSGRGLYVANGTNQAGALIAAGTASEPVVLTTSDAEPAPGQWEGIYFANGTDDAQSSLSFVTVDYAGQANSAAVRLIGAGPTISDSTFSNSSLHGVYATTNPSDATITDSTFVGNADYDVNYTATSGGGTIVLQGNTFEHGAFFTDKSYDLTVQNNTFQSYADGFWLRIPTDAVPALSGNVFEDTDVSSVVLVEGDSIGEDQLWPNPGLPYQITEADLDVLLTAVDPSTLTLTAGTELRFESGLGLDVAGNSVQGALVALGTPAEPIVFTTADITTPAPGQWKGLFFNDGTAASTVLDHVVVEYGGSSQANVYSDDGDFSISNCTIQHSLVYGVRLDDTATTVSDCTIADNGSYGVYGVGTSLFTVDGTTFSNNADYAVYFSSTSEATLLGNTIDTGVFSASSAGRPSITGNVFLCNGALPIVRVGADTADDMGANTFQDPSADCRVELIGETLVEDALWANVGVPYRVVSGTVTVANAAEPILTIAPGVTLEFDSAALMRIASGSTPGGLSAIGTELEPIVFTSSQETPAGGDWTHLRFDSGTVDSLTRLEWVTVEYAGDGSLATNVYVTSAAPTFENCTFSNGSGNGMEIVSSAPTVTFSRFEDNGGYGIETASGSTGAILRHNHVTGNALGGLNQTASDQIDARLNWWGDVDGPSGEGPGAGQAVTTNVVFNPWLEASPDTITGEDYITDLFQTTPAFVSGSRTRYFASFVEPTAWTLEVLDNVGGVVRSFSGTDADLVQDFDGLDTGGVVLPDGDYSFRLSGAGTGSGAPVVAARGTVAIDSTLPVAEIDNLLHLDVFEVGSQIDVVGSAEMGGFTTYSLQFGTGLFPSSYSNIVNNSGTEVMDATLGTWNTNNLTSGTYQVRLLVNNDLDEQAVVNLGSLILSLNSLDADEPAFSPNADGAKDEVTVTATLSLPADWALEVQDDLGAPVKSFAGSGGTVAEVWDGTLADGVTIAPEGVYTFSLEAMQEGAMVLLDTATTILDLTPPVASITTPAEDEEVFGTLDVIGTADDPDGNFQDYLLQFGLGPNPTSLTNVGSAVPTPVVDDVLQAWVTNDTEEIEPIVNTNYTLRLTSTDIAGNSAVDDVFVVLDNLVLGQVEASTRRINGHLGEMVDIDYSINKPADVTVTIYGEQDGATGPALRTYVQSHAADGRYGVTWDGRDEGGMVVPDEAYVYVLSATGGGGRTDVYDPTTGQAVGANSGSIPPNYNPYQNDFWSIDLNVSTGGRVRMTVTPSGETGFQVVDREPFEVGVHTIVWDGRRPDKSLVEQNVNVFFDPPTTLRPHHIITEGDTPEIITLASDPYQVYFSYGQVTDLEYTLGQDAVVTVAVLPPGIYDPAAPEAVVLVDGELQVAGDQSVEWDAVDGADPFGNLAVSEAEGPWSFTVEASNPTTGRSETRYGVITFLN